MIKSFKTISKVFTPPVVPEGDGAKVTRIIGTKHLQKLDPFLLLDCGSSKLPNGFPDHPHRGFETVSYVIEGTMLHEDSKGNKGTLNAGDCQWMTAGKGIVHAEIPASYEECSTGFQLWINLAAKDKFCDPQYQEIKKDSIPIASKEGVSVKVIAGESLGKKGPIYARTPAFYLDVTMDKNSSFEQDIPKDWNAFSYIYEGQAIFGQEKKKIDANNCVVYNKDEGETVVFETGEKSAKFLLIAGLPLNEEVFQYGPFVLSNEKDLMQAFEDYRLGKNGFEGAPGWKSKIRELARRK